MERERFMSSREWLWLWQWMRVRVCCFWQLVVAPWHLWLPAVVLALFVALSATHSQPHILALLLCWGYLVQYLYILLDHRRSELLSFNLLPFVFALLLAWFGASALLQLPWKSWLTYERRPGTSICASNHILGLLACFVGFPLTSLEDPGPFLLAMAVTFWLMFLPLAFFALTVWNRKSLQESWSLVSLFLLSLGMVTATICVSASVASVIIRLQ